MSRACILGCAGPRLSRDESSFFRDADPWGFILFARNVEAPDQVRRLTDELRAAVGWRAPVFVDQEGGRVQRLRPPHWRAWPPPLDHVRAARDPGRAMWIRARLMAEELNGVGIDATCAPTADVARPETHPFLRDRCFGTDPVAVAEAARATAEGFLAGGVLPVLKHMPGHGRARVDSHLGLPVVEAEREELEDDFAPFRALSGLPLGMTAHIRYSALGGRPATLDRAVIDLIRREIAFGGLLMTDDISMQALGGTIGARARQAIAAGCDVVLHCNGDRAEMEECIEVLGALTGPGLERAESALARRRPPEAADLQALEAELSDLTRGAVHG